jgi:hypothetical protein
MIMATPRYIILANPESLRLGAYEPELRTYWRERGLDVQITIVPWATIIEHDGHLDALREFDSAAVVRMESPGRDWRVSQLLLEAGRRQTNDPEPTDWLSLDYQLGRLVRPGLFYQGFCRILGNLRRAFDARPHLHPTACPLEVAEMFDKNATCARLRAAGIAIPETISEPNSVEELLTVTRERKFHTVYAKLNSGSSASAIAVLRPREDPMTAISSITRIEEGFYSTRRLRRHTGEDLEAVLAFLIRERVCVQKGIEMARIEGMNFDVRVVMIYGQPRFTIFRLSHNPMTNLHLGGKRGEQETCRSQIPMRIWLDGMDTCVEASGLYRSPMMGIDLMFENGWMRQVLLEVNAFGDFFPNLVDIAGKSVHRVEIEETAKRVWG